MFKLKLFLALFFVSLIACKEDLPAPVDNDYSDIYNLPTVPYNYSNIQFPTTFSEYVFSFDNTPIDNPITDEGATLGRVLFYDKQLSRNGTIACASCHKQELGFADGEPQSEGFDGQLGRRNAMGIANARFYKPKRFFWDHRAATLEDQVLMPFQNPLEMGMTLDGLVDKVASLAYYRPLFKNAFNDENVTSNRISKALAQFVRSIYSFNTKYDKGLEMTRDIFEDFPNFTPLENLGKRIFNGEATPEAIGTCVTCHLPNAIPLHYITGTSPNANQVIFSGGEADNIGLDPDTTGVDNGEGAFYGILGLFGHFKTPSLRNIELTAPYMHDGRFATLEEVVEHYSTGVLDHPYLSAHMKDSNGAPRHLELNPKEAAALVAFLKTLTDEELVNDERFFDPFLK